MLNSRILAHILVFVLASAILITAAFGFSKMIVFNPPHLLFVLNFALWSIATMLVVFISAKSFLKNDSITILLLGVSMILLGTSVITAGWFADISGDYSVAIGNICPLTASIVLVGAAVLAFVGKQKTGISRRKPLLATVYASSLIFVIAVAAIVLSGILPSFFLPSGPTLLRQVILGLTVFFFAVASIIFGAQYARIKSSTLFWYTFGIALFSLGFFSAYEVKALGDIATWLGRITLYVANSFLVIAVFEVRRRDNAGFGFANSWAQAFVADRSQSAALLASMLDAFVYGKMLVGTDGKPIDWIYLDVNESFEKMTGKTRFDIIGKRASQVFPEDRNDPSDWVGKYGTVALTGEPIKFQSYRRSFGKWLDVSVYSPQNGFFVSILGDITDRKKAEERIEKLLETVQQDRDRLSSLVTSIPDEVWFADNNKKLTLANPAAVKEFGLDTIGTDNVEKIAASFEVCRADGSPRPVEEAPHLRSLRGEVVRNETEIVKLPNSEALRYRQVNSAPVRNSRANIIGSVSIVRDITEMKKAEEALNYKNKRLALLSEITEKLLSSGNPQNTILEISEKVLTFLDCDVSFNFLLDNEKQKLHLNAYSGVPAETARTFEWLSLGEAVCGCAAQEGERIVCENIPDSQDHRAALVRSFGVKAYCANPIFSEGKVIGTLSFGSKKKAFFSPDDLSFMQTVTAQISVAMTRKLASEVVEKSEHLYRTVFDNSQDGFQLNQVIYDEKGKPVDCLFLKVNSAYERQSGIKAEDIVGKTERQFAPSTEQYWFDLLADVAKTGKTKHFENYNEPTKRWYDFYVFPYSKDTVGALLRDITERKVLEKQLQEKERLAAIGATAGMVGHDIRNPLQAITSDVYLAKSELTSIPDTEAKEKVIESLDEIAKNTDYINKIVQDLQDYARPMNPRPGQSNIVQIIEKIVDRNRLPSNIKPTIKVFEEAKLIEADSYYLNRILYNLVTNSIQAMPNGGKLIIKAYKEADDIIIAVKDTGVGIPTDVREKMFTVMFTTKSKGQGFGLPVVKRMTEALGGRVSYESEVGKGTTFMVRLPAKK